MSWVGGNMQTGAWDLGHDVAVKGVDQFKLKLQTLLPEVRAALLQVITTDADKMRERARAMAAGEVLQSRTGRFLASIKSEVKSTDTSVMGSVYSDDPRDPIFEYGGEQAARDILPNAAQVMRFMGSAGEVFAAVVHRPVVVYPKRPVIHAAFDEANAGSSESVGSDSTGNQITFEHRGLAGDIEAATHQAIIDLGA